MLAVTGWAASARVLRAQTMSLRSRDYVAAAKVAGSGRGGSSPWRSCRTCCRCWRRSSCSR
ncbi:hypothetical protein ACFQV2_11445 [Actinokineospora soli]|uniref:Uncharacterized protein n=1 Tax=Actinokineospora soli TaxID=1048753 RepID=A0ABW2TK16_9PSEU